MESQSSETEDPVEVSAVKELEVDVFVSKSNGTVAEVNQDSYVEDNNGEKTFSYERLKAKSSNPVTGIDYKQREAYLSNEEFQTVLGMTKDAFYRQPKWKQDMQKRKVDLF